MPYYSTRFAPTPSGQLHFGSLVTAVGSYLRAKSQKGFWHIRIEDIDSTRCKPSYTQNIINTINDFGFEINGEILIQSERLDIYNKYLIHLKDKGFTYNCHCSRAQIKEMGGHYLNCCRDKQLLENNSAIRFKNLTEPSSFEDIIFKQVTNDKTLTNLNEDFILKRRDNIFAYNLVCVIDDELTKITEVVRGMDLLDTTFQQISLMNALEFNIPKYMHLPIVKSENGLKLSKQNHAKPLDLSKKSQLLKDALQFLNQYVPETNTPVQILEEAAKYFDINSIKII